jgi:hypothetical protein
MGAWLTDGWPGCQRPDAKRGAHRGMIILKLLAAGVGASLLVWGYWRWSNDGQPNVWVAVFAAASKSRLPIFAMIVGFFAVGWGVSFLI